MDCLLKKRCAYLNFLEKYVDSDLCAIGWSFNWAPAV